MSEIVSPAAAASSKVKYRAYFVAGRLDDTHSSVQEPSSLDSPNIDLRVVVHPLTVGAAFVAASRCIDHAPQSVRNVVPSPYALTSNR